MTDMIFMSDPCAPEPIPLAYQFHRQSAFHLCPAIRFGASIETRKESVHVADSTAGDRTVARRTHSLQCGRFGGTPNCCRRVLALGPDQGRGLPHPRGDILSVSVRVQ